MKGENEQKEREFKKKKKNLKYTNSTAAMKLIVPQGSDHLSTEKTHLTEKAHDQIR